MVYDGGSIVNSICNLCKISSNALFNKQLATGATVFTI